MALFKRNSSVVDGNRRRGFLRRLCRDTAGNTLAIVGAALIPLTAMIGSGIDVSRAYMAKSRLQSACDAASLAARRVMRNDSLTADVMATGERFFSFNFPAGLYQTEAFSPEITRPEVGIVRIDAATRIPTAVMKLFGFGTLPLSVSCEASLNFVNTDVVLVLDVTGSMMNDVNDNATNVDANRKITALQDAVMALYDELAPIQAQLESQGLRLRYGIVPYSNTVNVGRLLQAQNSDFIRASTPYQSRVAIYNTTPATETVSITSPETGLLASPGVERFRVSGVDRQITNANCANFGSNTAFSQGGTSPVGGSYASVGVSNDADFYDPDGPAGPQANEPAAPTGYVRYQFSRRTASWTNNPTNRVCERNVTITRRTYPYSFSQWQYREEQLDTSSFAGGGAITLATTAPGTLPTGGGVYDMQELVGVGGGGLQTVTWNGCIEERDTVSTINGGSSLTIPSGATDLDLNFIPNSEATRWRPMLAQATYQRTAGNGATTPGGGASTNNNWMPSLYTPSQGYYACPTEARRLQTWARDDQGGVQGLSGYVRSLAPVGGTYHDIGMIWGGRLISTGGPFADACEEFNGMPCNRHVIFMTDGQQTAYCNVYTAYGPERNALRVKNANNCTSDAQGDANTADLLNRHRQRFQMACNATKNMNTSVWVIAFGTSLSTPLTQCATNASQASTSANREQLISRFRQIGNQIGALRLTN